MCMGTFGIYGGVYLDVLSMVYGNFGNVRSRTVDEDTL